VVEQINRYLKSIHARPSIEDQSRTNATSGHGREVLEEANPNAAI